MCNSFDRCSLVSALQRIREARIGKAISEEKGGIDSSELEYKLFLYPQTLLCLLLFEVLTNGIYSDFYLLFVHV